VTFFRNGQEVGDDDLALLRARGVAVVGGGVAALEVEDDRLTGVRLDDGTFITREAVVVGPRFVANAAFLESLGQKMVEHPMGVGDYLPVDPMTYRTDVPGVWAAGNVTDFSAQVGMSAAAGAMAGAQINADLVMTG
jgi:thioredoxin reductase